jgi:1,4-dihydroxy-2-naphthoyl-CoA synthase
VDSVAAFAFLFLPYRRPEKMMSSHERSGTGGTLTFRKTGHCMVVDLAAGPDDEAAAQIPSELAELCDQIAWDEETRVVVLAFGGEMKHNLSEFVAGVKQPVIAAIRGDAMGPGLELALACDIRIGTETARFGLPQIRDGRMPSGGGTQRLPRIIGKGKAVEMILTGDLIDAEEAHRIGLLNRVVASAMVMNTAMEMANDMASKSPLSLSYAKEALYSGMDLTLDQGLKMELDLYLLLFSTFDRVEGITAFKEKRKAKFEGK